MFSFSVSNKPVLLMSGVLEAVVALTSTDIMAVVFKLLGVLRMLVDGQGIIIHVNFYLLSNKI